MGAFALVFVPPWIAFRLARSWRWTLILSVALGVAAYLLAFGLALGLDQPFGPVLVAVLVGAGGLGGGPAGSALIRCDRMQAPPGTRPRPGIGWPGRGLLCRDPHQA